MGGQENVFALLQSKPFVNIACFYFLQVVVHHLRHGAAHHISAFLGQAIIRQIAASVFGIAHVHIADDIYNEAVGFLRQTLVLAAVARLHVENRDVQSLCTEDRQARVGITQHQNRIGLQPGHHVIGLGNDVPHGLTKGIAHRIHVYIRRIQIKIMEEHAVEVVIVILPCIG